MGADIRLQKKVIYRVRMMAAVNFLEAIYTGKRSTETADIETVKIHTKCIMSSPGTEWCALEFNNMYLDTVLGLLTPAYMRVHIPMIPDNIRTEYVINDDYVDNKRFVYFEVTKAIYGLI